MGNIVQMPGSPKKEKIKKGHTNGDLKKEFLSRGFYVNSVGRGGDEDIDYLIVSCDPPKKDV